MSKLENLQICIKDGEVIALQGLDTVTAERLEDILNYVAEVKESLDRHKLNNRATGIKRVTDNCKKFIRCCKYAAKK
ncbi:hypothetical protein [Ruminococcus sp.]|uniref:hypothetical protein n=1 Tax=Ruminococcus sp. TaxID=41978 RepID=UPI003F80878B